MHRRRRKQWSFCWNITAGFRGLLEEINQQVQVEWCRFSAFDVCCQPFDGFFHFFAVLLTSFLLLLKCLTAFKFSSSWSVQWLSKLLVASRKFHTFEKFAQLGQYLFFRNCEANSFFCSPMFSAFSSYFQYCQVDVNQMYITFFLLFCVYNFFNLSNSSALHYAFAFVQLQLPQIK